MLRDLEMKLNDFSYANASLDATITTKPFRRFQENRMMAFVEAIFLSTQVSILF